MIALASRAADAAASGVPMPKDVASLVGRRFELTIPFGCSGPAASDSNAPLRWRYDAASQALRIHVSSTVWQPADWGIAEPKEPGRIAEGFWISRPWTSSETCPALSGQAAAADAEPVTLPGQTLAIAEFRPAGSGGRAQPSRSFDTVKRISPQELIAAHGFGLKLTGRIESLPNGMPVRCHQPAGGEQRPICVIAVSFGDLELANPGTIGSLATWSLDRAPQPD
jgi:hypothetical protein